jgi:hypothetical protein
VYNKIGLLLDEAGSYDGELNLHPALPVIDKAFQMDPMVPSFFVWHGTVLALMIRRLILVEGSWR